MLALKLLWIFTIAAGISIGAALVVCLVVRLIQSNPEDTPNSLVNRVPVPVNCFRLIKGDGAEQRRVVQYQKNHPKKVISNEDYINMTSDCAKFIETRGYITSPLSDDEKNFPLAFGILVSKDVELFERLLRAVYRPQNVYCVHVDNKANSTLHNAVSQIAGCFENVFVLGNNTVESTWGMHLVLEPDIQCMEALLKYENWRYFISLTGHEFPLRTNWELVQILKVLRGVTIIDANINLPPPDGLAGDLAPRIDVSFLKAPVHIAAKRHFIQFAVNDEKARQTSNWTQPVRLPSRFYFSPPNSESGRQVGGPGRQMGERQFINRYKIWQTIKLPCRGKYSEGVCTFGIRDLPMLAASPHFFASTFDLDFEPLGLDCLEELIFNRTQEELLGLSDFNTCYYECLLH